MDKISKQENGFSDWYNELILNSELADYSDVKGCMIIKPYGYAIWERIKEILDKKIKEMGVDNVYLPLFIPESYFAKEAEHVEGFAPEVAWVTHAGGKKLEEKLAIRPTSETIMYKTFAKWVTSYRDLPLQVNQWANVVRWEKRTRLFLRTSEFLWQEGHTLHVEKKEAEEMLEKALQAYKDFAENYLGIYILDGQKTDQEKFAGADYTKSIEGLMKDGKALQMGTSHLLNQSFAESFGVSYASEEGGEKVPYSTSWGVSTRLIGGLIMAHGDDKGLVLPPAIAPIEVVIVPIWKTEEEKKNIAEYLERISEQLNNFRIKIDFDDTKSPGWKFNNWEMKGVPVRLEVGPRDLSSESVVLVRRDTGDKQTVAFGDLEKETREILDSIQGNLFNRHRDFVNSKIKEFTDYDQFTKEAQSKNMVALVGWCGSAECEEKVKDDTKYTTRVFAKGEKEGTCLCCGQKTNKQVYLAKAY